MEGSFLHGNVGLVATKSIKYFHLLPFISQVVSVVVVICVSVKRFCFQLVFLTRTWATLR